MSAKLQKFVELTTEKRGQRDYLAIGYVEFDQEKDFPWKVVRAGEDDKPSWFSSYPEAFQHLAEGLVPPSNVYTML